MKHLRLARNVVNRFSLTREKEKSIMRSICEMARETGLSVTMASYLEDSEMNLPPVSIRLTCSNQLDADDISLAANKLKTVCQTILRQL